jgi:uncharacterized protein (TIGR03083 family)
LGVQLNPRYEEPPVLRFDLSIADPSAPLERQRRRLTELLATLDHDQWSTPSRCDGWSVKDVVAHLIGTNQFWNLSIAAGLAGEPTRLLTSFDPVSTPAAMVEALGSVEPTTLLEQLTNSNDALAETIAGLDAEAWSMPAEAPPGHLAVRAVVLHALWDAWIHERDIMLPLGLEQAWEEDEVTGCILYVSALGPMFLATAGSNRIGTLGVTATDLGLSFLVEVGETVVIHDGSAAEGDASLVGLGVQLVESLSCRASSPATLIAADQWMLEGLPMMFEVAT